MHVLVEKWNKKREEGTNSFQSILSNNSVCVPNADTITFLIIAVHCSLSLFSTIPHQRPGNDRAASSGDRTQAQDVADEDVVDDEGDAQRVSSQPERKARRLAKRTPVHLA